MHSPVPSRLSRGTRRDGIGMGFSKWDGIVPTLRGAEKKPERDGKRWNGVQRNGTERKRSRNGTENGAEWRGKGTKNEKDVEVEAERL